MIIATSAQGTQAWLEERAGAITASLFYLARSRSGMLDAKQQQYVDYRLDGMNEKTAASLAGYKQVPKSKAIEQALDGQPVGEYTTGAQDYAFKLALERIAGRMLNDDHYETRAMKRGKELEGEAREHHAMDLMLFDGIHEIGFLKTDDGRFGATPDGYIQAASGNLHDARNTGCEYKCFISPSRLRQIILEKDYSCVMDQIQGGMWVTGWQSWDFVLYCPQLEGTPFHYTRVTIARDDDYIEALEADLLAFDALVEDYVQRLTALNA